MTPEDCKGSGTKRAEVEEPCSFGAWTLASPIPGANQVLVEKVRAWGGSTSENPAFPYSKDGKTKESLKMTLMPSILSTAFSLHKHY